MSTNYYARTAETPQGDEGLHIGKHSGGWDFLFRAHPELGLTNCEAWHDYLSRPGVQIVAEHGLVEELDQFWVDATQRPADVGGVHVMRPHFPTGPHRKGESVDQHGHPFVDYEFC